MSKKPFPPPYDILTDLLVAARRATGITQSELAERLSIGQSSVSKIERGVQRLDMVELHRWLSAIGGQSFTAFASSFDDRVRTQTAADRGWGRAKRSAALTAVRVRSVRKT
jgi:transcriptional regulator with XRE-family HTH domain